LERLYKIDMQIYEGKVFSVFGTQVTLLNALEESLRTGLFMVAGVIALPNQEEQKALQEAMRAKQAEQFDKAFAELEQKVAGGKTNK
jgi:hypothetical protein